MRHTHVCRVPPAPVRCHRPPKELAPEESSLSTVLEPARPTSRKPDETPRPGGRVTRWMERHVEANPSAGSPEGYLDGARGVAITAVVVIHVWGFSGRPKFVVLGHGTDFIFARLGWGVDLFFLLSGFLLSRPWFTAELAGRPGPSLKKYFGRRAARLVPGYYVSIAVLLALLVPLGAVRTDSLVGSIGLWNIGPHLLFLQNALPLSSSDFNGMNGVYWTLTMEFLFYLTLPLAVRLFMGGRAVVMPLLGLLVSEVWIYLCLHSMGGLVRLYVGAAAAPNGNKVSVAPSESYMRPLLANQFPTWCFVFALGIALARLVVRYRAGALHSRLLDPRFALAAVFVGAAGMVYVCHRVTKDNVLHPASNLPYYYGHTGFALSLAMIVFGLTFGPRWLRRPLESLPVRYLGWVSYGVYLYHLLVLRCLFDMTSLRQHSEVTQFLVGLLLTAAIAVPLATLSWLVIERPFLQRHRRDEPARVRERRWATVATAAIALPAGALLFSTHATDPVAKPVARGTLGTIPGVELVGRFTGASTPARADALGAIYPQEKAYLTSCGSTSGAIEGLSVPAWGANGSVFSCADEAAARAAFAVLPAWERALGYTPVASDRSGIHTFYRNAPDGLPQDPYHFHIRYRSGKDIVGVVISAQSRSEGEQAVRLILKACTKVHPPAP